MARLFKTDLFLGDVDFAILAKEICATDSCVYFINIFAFPFMLVYVQLVVRFEFDCRIRSIEGINFVHRANPSPQTEGNHRNRNHSGIGD